LINPPKTKKNSKTETDLENIDLKVKQNKIAFAILLKAAVPLNLFFSLGLCGMVHEITQRFYCNKSFAMLVLMGTHGNEYP
jgi:hypothetical protein